MPQVVVQDTLVSYKDTGKGPVLLCVHGWMHDAGTYDNLTEELKSSHRIVSLDLPNFGNSQIDERVYSISDYAKFLSVFVAKLKLKNYTLVGHSMGGQIAIKAVADGVLEPRKLILIASAGVRDDRKTYKFFLKSMSRVFRHITPKRLKNRFYSAIGSDYSADLSDVHKKVINQTLGTDILADAKRVATPALLIYGSKDASTPPWMGEKLAGAITGSRLEVIEGENHWLHQTSADQTAKIVREFVDA